MISMSAISRALCVVGIVMLHSVSEVAAQASTDAFGPLHGRAVKNGGRLKEAAAFDVQGAAGTLHELIARSESTIVGRVLNVRCRPAEGRDRIETTAAVFVQEVLRGPLRAGGLVYLVVPGGAHRFSDGVTVHQSVPEYRMLLAEKSYLLTVQRKPGRVHLGQPVVTLAAGAQSQFELDFEHDQVVPCVLHPLDPIQVRYRGTNLATFLSEAHARQRLGADPRN